MSFTPLEIVAMLAFFIMYGMNVKLSRRIQRMESFNEFQMHVFIGIAEKRITVTKYGNRIKFEEKETPNDYISARPESS